MSFIKKLKRMKNNILILFILYSLSGFSQQTLKGKVETGGLLSNILVVNLTNQTETLTDGLGRFSIMAKEGDLLIFSGESIQRKRILIEKEHLEKEIIIIPLEIKNIEIEAVTIQKFDINPEDLGLVPRGQKRYTQAERRLFTAQDEQHLGALINLISGRTKMLKTIAKMEKEDKKVAYLSDLFEEDFYTIKLKIESQHVTEFKYFSVHFIEKELSKNTLKNVCGEDEKNYLKSLSKKEIELILISLSEKYLELKNEMITNEE